MAKKSENGGTPVFAKFWRIRRRQILQSGGFRGTPPNPDPKICQKMTIFSIFEKIADPSGLTPPVHENANFRGCGPKNPNCGEPKSGHFSDIFFHKKMIRKFDANLVHKRTFSGSIQTRSLWTGRIDDLLGGQMVHLKTGLKRPGRPEVQFLGSKIGPRGRHPKFFGGVVTQVLQDLKNRDFWGPQKSQIFVFFGGPIKKTHLCDFFDHNRKIPLGNFLYHQRFRARYVATT